MRHARLATIGAADCLRRRQVFVRAHHSLAGAAATSARIWHLYSPESNIGTGTREALLSSTSLFDRKSMYLSDNQPGKSNYLCGGC
jgi:hypothetical protein